MYQSTTLCFTEATLCAEVGLWRTKYDYYHDIQNKSFSLYSDLKTV